MIIYSAMIAADVTNFLILPLFAFYYDDGDRDLFGFDSQFLFKDSVNPLVCWHQDYK